MKTEIKIQFVTRKDTTTAEFCRAFLDVFINHHPQLTPEFYDTRPERECVKPYIGVEDALKTWAWRGMIQQVNKGVIEDEWVSISPNYIKRKNRVKYYAAINHTATNRRGDSIFGLISIYASADRKTDWLAVFRDLTEVVEPILGRMHIYTGAEAKGFPFGSPQMTFLAGPSQPEIRDGLTNLGWANVFSEEYAAEVDNGRLSINGFAVEAGPKGKLFTVTDNLFDVMDEFGIFSRRRAELKALFRPDLFLITSEPN